MPTIDIDLGIMIFPPRFNTLNKAMSEQSPGRLPEIQTGTIIPAQIST
jgi:hypothetical protein